ncbi:asparagine synthase-related protein, partial [Candidatus Magnetobacterium casense]
MSLVAGIVNLKGQPVSGLLDKIASMTDTMKHRGECQNFVDACHMGLAGTGTQKDGEVVLHDGVNGVQVRYQNGVLECTRDRMGCKPLYWAVVGNEFYFASEAKALLPFLPKVEMNIEGLVDYLHFQYYLGGKTLFKGINELLPAQMLTVKNGKVEAKHYWQVRYNIDYDHTQRWFEAKLRDLLESNIQWCLQDNAGVYVSGGIDSGAVASIAANVANFNRPEGYHGRFEEQGYDESHYASLVAENCGISLHSKTITCKDFL